MVGRIGTKGVTGQTKLLKRKIDRAGESSISFTRRGATLYVVRFVDSKGEMQERHMFDFDSANTLAKSIREFYPRVSVKKIGEVARRWDVYLFAPELPLPQLIQKNLRTHVARLTWVTWDNREHHSVIVCWPSDQPIPSSWISSF